MSDRGSPSDHAATDTQVPKDDAPASAPSQDTGQPDGTDANSPAADPSPAADQGATKDAKQPTLAEVIKTAADLPDVPGSSPTPAKDGKDNAADLVRQPAPDRGAAPSEPDDSKLSFHKHPRWQEVTGQNRQLRDQVATLVPDADQFRKINSFMQEHHLSPDEVGDLFIVGAMMKAGDARALQKLDEYRNNFALAIGEAIPQDIQDKIDIGEISEAAGKELAKARATLAVSERQTAERTARETRDQATRARESLALQQATAVSAWDAETRKTDPDFAKKEKAIARYARALMQEHGLPQNAEQAVQVIKAAYAEVNRDFAQALPPKSAARRVPVAPSSNGAKPAPKSLREVVEAAAAMN